MTPRIHPKFLAVLLFINALFLTGAGVAFFYAQKGHASPLPDYGRVADFLLTDKSQKNLSLENLKGAPWVANFMFTRCTGQCPAMNLKMSGLQHQLEKKIKLVSISVDPQNDSPQTLAQYARRLGAQEGRWSFLTGPQETLRRLLASFHLPVSEDPNAHSLSLILVDRSGRIRGYYDSADDGALRKLVQDAEALSKNS